MVRVWLVVAGLLLAGVVWAETPRARGELAIEDVLQVHLLDRELVALDAVGGGGPRERLEIGETLLWRASRGRVAVAMTDRRMLAVGVGSASWQAARYRSGEAVPDDARLGDRVALWVTRKRAFGFDGGTGNLIDVDLGPRESLLGSDVAANAGVIVTDRRALGISPFAGGFFSTRLRLGEAIESIEASGNFATVLTSRRLLTFRSPTGGWESRDRNLR